LLVKIDTKIHLKTCLDVQAWEITCLETMISTNPTGIAIIQESHLCERLPKSAKGCPSVRIIARKVAQTERNVA